MFNRWDFPKLNINKKCNLHKEDKTKYNSNKKECAPVPVEIHKYIFFYFIFFFIFTLISLEILELRQGVHMDPNIFETALIYHFYIHPWIQWFRVDGTSTRVKDFKNIQIH